MPIILPYDLSGINDDGFLCGPYVCSPSKHGVDSINPKLLNKDIENQSKYSKQKEQLKTRGFAEVDTIDLQAINTTQTPLTKYHLSLLDLYGVISFLFKEIQVNTKDFVVKSHLHFYPKRPKESIGLHHDTLGQTFFVILHYFNENTIYGPEYTFNTSDLFLEEMDKNPDSLFNGFLLKNPYQGPIDTSGAWPAKLQSIMKEARNKLIKAYGKNTMIKHTLIPPYGSVGFVDELVHHSTPLMGSRGQNHQVNFSTVQIRPSKESYPIGNRARSHSFEEKNNSLNQLAVQESNEAERSFMRVWVTITKT